MYRELKSRRELLLRVDRDRENRNRAELRKSVARWAGIAGIALRDEEHAE
jgi:hypothetical protein